MVTNARFTNEVDLPKLGALRSRAQGPIGCNRSSDATSGGHCELTIAAEYGKPIGCIDVVEEEGVVSRTRDVMPRVNEGRLRAADALQSVQLVRHPCAQNSCMLL